jgi:hypothetical protein
MIRRHGTVYAETSREAARLLGPDITPENVRDWTRRSRTPGDRLYGVITPYRYRGRTYLPLPDVARAEGMTARPGNRAAELTPTAPVPDPLLTPVP